MWNLFKKGGAPAQRIYLDYASATPLLPEVLRAMAPYWSERFGNPGALYAEGVDAARALETARVECARALSVQAAEVTFTSGGTESNNLAILGLLKQKIQETPGGTFHVISMAIEHSSILEPLVELARQGVQVSYVSVRADGVIDLAALKAALTPQTVLVSVHLANSEIGVIQPLRDIARLLDETYGKEKRPVLHSDAAQAPLFLEVSLERLGVDMLTLDGQKMGGPKGVGALVHRKHIPLCSIIGGGGQERGLRSGTEPVPLIVGFTAALSAAVRGREERVRRVKELRDRFLGELLQRLPQAILNGSATERIANNVNVSIPGVDTEFLVLRLDHEGIAVSTKSTCLSDEVASSVVAALGKGEEVARSTLRITLGTDTTWSELARTLDVLERLVANLDIR